MKAIRPTLLARLAAAFLLVAGGAHGAATSTGIQNPALLKAAVTRFLARETAGMNGETGFEVTAPRSALPSCPAPEAFLPPGARLIGKTTVGVRCTAPRWTVYLAARVTLVADYAALAQPRPAGYALTAADVVTKRGDLGALPQDVLTDASVAPGMELVSGLAAGAPLRTRLLRQPLIARAGQKLVLLLDGPGFSLRNEGTALANARIGDTIRVKSAGGAVVSGVVTPDGSVHVDYTE